MRRRVSLDVDDLRHRLEVSVGDVGRVGVSLPDPSKKKAIPEAAALSNAARDMHTHL